MNSMTGYGKGEAELGGRKATVELKSVNHRFLDLSIKLPRGFQFVEDSIKKAISASCTRGHIDAYVNYEDNRESKAVISIDYDLVQQYINASLQLAAKGFSDNLGVAEILKVPDVVKIVADTDDENEIQKVVVEAAQKAVVALVKMRGAEGARLVADLKLKLIDIQNGVNRIAVQAPNVQIEHREKMIERIQEVLGDVTLDEQKLANEVAFYADKCNIDEEITRLNGHIAHYNEIFSAGGAMGKKLDFLTQETNREVNTIGSKSNNSIITKEVLLLKNIVEMIREQVQNIE
ncbi:MAG: YicC/YloC family endoribonuclease [Bacillota bacterium]